MKCRYFCMGSPWQGHQPTLMPLCHSKLLPWVLHLGRQQDLHLTIWGTFIFGPQSGHITGPTKRKAPLIFFKIYFCIWKTSLTELVSAAFLWNGCKSQNWTIESQKAGVSLDFSHGCRSPVRVSHTVFQGVSFGRCIRNGTSGTWTSSQMGCQRCRQKLNMVHHHASSSISWKL